MMYTYTQRPKNVARHEALSYAIDLLTTNRNKACCVGRRYVRNIYDYFISLDESREKSEAEKIDISYIKQWEKLHDSCVGNKSPEDLVVCYLCGTEPNNDFREFIDLGILPQNIWAFENDMETYRTAILSYDYGTFPQPKIVKEKIEMFFQYTPKKFDIVYIDACGAVPSKQHALRSYSLLCKYHRLNSPGIVITNFASPDITKDSVKSDYLELLALYFLFKKFPNENIKIGEGGICTEAYKFLKTQIDVDFDKYYGNFISSILGDISSIIVPIQRFTNSSFVNHILSSRPTLVPNTLDYINGIKNNSLTKYIYTANILSSNGNLDNKTKILLNEVEIANGSQNDIFHSFDCLYRLKTNQVELNEEIKDIQQYFEKKENIYQFLDKPHSNMFFDLFINQIAYPLHYNTEAIRRFSYTAKKTKMYMDITVLDECRYIYEWLPSLHQLTSAFSNASWQYVFRFALDGLVKNRYQYNNEFFFQGSVVSNSIKGFSDKKIADRENIN